jgi:hypothetical protein
VICVLGGRAVSTRETERGRQSASNVCNEDAESTARCNVSRSRRQEYVRRECHLGAIAHTINSGTYQEIPEQKTYLSNPVLRISIALNNRSANSSIPLFTSRRYDAPYHSSLPSAACPSSVLVAGGNLSTDGQEEI